MDASQAERRGGGPIFCLKAMDLVKLLNSTNISLFSYFILFEEGKRGGSPLFFLQSWNQRQVRKISHEK